ncbi:unnamed protein product, partial [Clonostachys rosea f. rosea IK726]
FIRGSVIWLCESELHPWLLALEHSGGEYGQCFEDGLIRLVAWICVVLNVYSEDLVIIRPYQSQRTVNSVLLSKPQRKPKRRCWRRWGAVSVHKNYTKVVNCGILGWCLGIHAANGVRPLTCTALDKPKHSNSLTDDRVVQRIHAESNEFLFSLPAMS